MHWLLSSFLMAWLACLVSVSTADEGEYIELNFTDMVENPPPVEIDPSIACEQSVWCQFRPNLNKLILSGAADTEHISILWYPIVNGSVGLHYHGKTESVYTIEGTQADIKGVYPKGSVYFNPPGSGHSVWDSGGFFLLSYAAPPDFANTDLISEYTPVIIDTTKDGNVTSVATLVADNGHTEYMVPLDETGGMSAAFLQGLDTPYAYEGNYVLVLEGPCMINGKEYDEQMLIVAKEIPTISFEVEGTECMVLGLAFTPPDESSDPSDVALLHGSSMYVLALSVILASLAILY